MSDFLDPIVSWLRSIDYSFWHIILLACFLAVYAYAQLWVFNQRKGERAAGHLLNVSADVYAIAAFFGLSGYFMDTPWLLLISLGVFLIVHIISAAISAEEFVVGLVLAGYTLLILMPVYLFSWILSLFLADLGVLPDGSFVNVCFWMQFFCCAILQVLYTF